MSCFALLARWGKPLNEENETLRWPTSLDREAIIGRLVQIRESARVGNLPEIAALFDNITSMSGPQIGAKVIAAITQLQEKPEHQVMATQLSMIAMNLKNLK